MRAFGARTSGLLYTSLKSVSLFPADRLTSAILISAEESQSAQRFIDHPDAEVHKLQPRTGRRESFFEGIGLNVRLRIQDFDLVCRHDLNLRLTFPKSDCATDAYGFPLDHSESLIARHGGPGRNEPSECCRGIPLRN